MHVDEKIYKEARNTVQNLIRKKRKAYFEEKIKEDTANRQNIWKTLTRLLCTDVCLKEKEELKFDPFKISESFLKIMFQSRE